MTEWKTYKLSDVVQFNPTERIVKGSLAKKVSMDKLIPYCREVSGYEIETFSGGMKFRNGDTIMARITPCLENGKTSLVSFLDDNEVGFGSTEYIVFRAIDGVTDSKFIYYFVTNPTFRNVAIKSMVGSSGRQRVQQSVLEELEVTLPSLEDQRKIAGILGALDDKIENNRRINDNLEQQAQALYKQWFVDNRSDDWEEKPLAEIAEFIGGYSYKGNELVDTSTMAMATIKNFERKGGFKVDGFKDIVASPKLKAEQHAELFDILVAHTDLTQNADVIGNAEILLTCGGYSDIIFSMDLVKVLPKENFPYKYLLAAMLKNPYFKAHCLGYVNGTTVLHMSKKALPEYVLACPSNKEAERMDNAFKAYYRKMAEILQENETLATLRDALLPKLMNGEIKVDDISVD